MEVDPNVLAYHMERNKELSRELLALREKYSTKCEECGGAGYLSCPSNDNSDGTEPCINPYCIDGRVMMLDAEGVKAESIEKDDDDEIDDGWKGAMKRVLKGGSQWWIKILIHMLGSTMES
jgi:hypothetical protein